MEVLVSCLCQTFSKDASSLEVSLSETVDYISTATQWTNRHLPSDSSGRFENSPFFSLKSPSVCNIDVLHKAYRKSSQIYHFLYHYYNTLVQLHVPETNVGNILLSFCQGFLIFHLRPLVATTWSSHVRNFARGCWIYISSFYCQDTIFSLFDCDVTCNVTLLYNRF